MDANDDSPILDADLDDSLDAQLAYEAEQAAQQGVDDLDTFTVEMDANELVADALRLDGVPEDDATDYVPAFAVLED